MRIFSKRIAILGFMMIDTHAHYDDTVYDCDREEVLRELRASGVTQVIDAASDLASFEKILSLVHRTSGEDGESTQGESPVFYAALGIHPENAKEWSGKVGEVLCRKKRENPKWIVAIGEIGLDYHYPDPPREVQQRALEEQIEVAKELALPIVIHSRDAAKDTLDLLKRTDAAANGGDVHCFSYSRESAREFLELGFHLGIGGVLTFKNAQKIKEVVEYMPLSRILLETDAPYLTPEPFRGKRNSSAYLSYVVKAIAEIKGISAEKVLETVNENARSLFHIEE
jgi:hydrolase, tatD family